MKCAKQDCKNEATKALKVTFVNVDTFIGPQEVVGYIALPVCDDIHMPDAEVQEFLALNWKQLVMGLCNLDGFVPDPARVKAEWRPWEEADEFWNDEQQAN